MAILPQPSLFNWCDIEASSDLDRLRLVLRSMPDEALVAQLESERGRRGRNDYPVRACWNALLACYVFQHPSVEALLRELRRNAELRQVCGFDLLLGDRAVPSSWAFSRFMASVIAHRELVRAMFDGLVEEVAGLLPELGEFLAADGKALASFGRPPRRSADGSPQRQGADGRTERDADWGAKTKVWTDRQGVEHVKEAYWFGFKLHLLVDSRSELPLAYELTKASVQEKTRLQPLLRAYAQQHPSLLARGRELSADKGYDSTRNQAAVWDEFRLRPVIDIIASWQDEHGGTRALVTDGCDSVVYDERGRVSCVCPRTGTLRRMAFWGFEAARESLKYRCPQTARGLECAGREECPGAQSEYGKLVRIPLSTDRRLFVPVPRDTPGWDQAYARRTAVERVNSRLDRVLGFEQHTVRGQAKMETRVGLGLAVMLAMAVGRIRSGEPEKMRSLLAPVARAA